MIKSGLLASGFLLVLILLESSFSGLVIGESTKNLFPKQAIKILQQQEHLDIDVFAGEKTLVGQSVATFLEPVLQYMPDVEIHYIDPVANPDLLRENGISMQGEMLFRNLNKRLHLKELSYETMINLLVQLNNDSSKWLVFLEGFGVRELGSDLDDGLAKMLLALRHSGYSVARMNFDVKTKIPDNVNLLIVPAPTKTIGIEQIKWLESNIAKGISIWWLTEPELADKQEYLSLLFDVIPVADVKDSQLLLESFPKHPVNLNFRQAIHLVQAMRFDSMTTALWQDDQNRRIAASQEIGEARLIVTGDADFISNQYLYTAGNKNMAIRMIDWLLFNDDRISLAPQGIEQSQLHLNKIEVLWFSGLMLIFIPVLLLLIALLMWRRSKC
ncbi:MAG: GldG family protein [Proteobacteria bacterium]|nr:GldG family protein [Pseudomonadota bacterium]